MAEIGKKISYKGLKDYSILREVAEKLKLKVSTLKRWVKEEKVEGVTWGYDRRGWIIVHKDSIPAIRRYRDKIDLVKHRK